LSGGDLRIQDAIFNHLQEMKDIIENNKFAGNVTTFKKTSTDPVQTSLSQEIINLINDGTSIITFFGHSSAGTFDFSIEDPSKYDNTGRYPIVLSLGCHSGDIHETVFSLSEDFILTKDRGSIAFIASSGNAFIPQLASYAKGMYTDLGGDFYGEPIGVVIQKILEEQYNPVNARSVTLHQQNTLHGDPAVRLYMAEGPDYTVDFPSITTMGDVGTLDEQINFSFDIINLGSGVQDSISNYLVHEYGDNQKDTIYFRTAAPFNRAEISLKLPNPGTEALGKNIINIVLDYKNEVEEYPNPVGEENNELKTAYSNEGYCFFVFDNSAFPVYPPEFGIVYQQDLTLSASATNAFAAKELFIIELDTTENFDSPFLRRTEIESSPSLVQWKPGITLENEKVYYWRISPKENTGQAKWNTSSFVFLENGSDGWNQSHLYQWQRDNFNNYIYDEDYREFLFAEDLKEIRVKNGTFRLTRPSISYQNEKSEYIEFDEHINQGVYISSFDGVTGLPMTNEIPSLYGSYFSSPWAENWMNFPYETHNKNERAKAINFIENIIPDGNFVVVYTIQRSDLNTNYRPEDWASDGSNGDPDLMSIFEKYGANRVRELESGARPYIFVFKKNDTNFTPIEVVAEDATEEIEAEFKILGRWFEGSFYSTTIGPAQEWNNLIWEIEQFENDEDYYRLDIVGVRSDEVEDTLYREISSFDFDLSEINANTYPYLKLNFYAIDEVSRTSPQLNFWRVMYKEKAEAVLNINERFVFKADTLFLGNDLSIQTKATNISQTDMDSLLVRYTIVDGTNSEINVLERLAPLPAQQSVDIEFTHPTNDLLGVNQFRVEINPDMDQPEQFSFNNVGVIDFTVQGDLINPLLDVTFDGVRIMDGEIISPVPLITVTLKDENEFLYIEDLSSFDLAIQKLPDPQAVPIDLNSSTITFYPADSTNNNLARLEYEAEFETGDYVLYVQARDASGNLSGDQILEIRFKVVAESMVSNVLNYPNPFSTSTEFVFTLTGHVVPDIFTIQIMTLSGKVVREITREELGDLRIGINRSNYKWNGTDEYG
ncbi:MAG: hypothetical protein KJO29_08700, partial [Bacteroidia bacterium]|nr:hypothetical protein [Bacteroidia bacterium]